MNSETVLRILWGQTKIVELFIVTSLQRIHFLYRHANYHLFRWFTITLECVVNQRDSWDWVAHFPQEKHIRISARKKCINPFRIGHFWPFFFSLLQNKSTKDLNLLSIPWIFTFSPKNNIILFPFTLWQIRNDMVKLKFKFVFFSLSVWQSQTDISTASCPLFSPLNCAVFFQLIRAFEIV